MPTKTKINFNMTLSLTVHVLCLIAFFLMFVQSAAAQTISGTVFNPQNVYIKVNQSGNITFVPVNQSTGAWSLQLTASGPYEVSANNTVGDLCDPPARGGQPVDTSGLDFSMLDKNVYKQVSGRVTLNGSGVRDVTITTTQLGTQTTSKGNNGEIPAGMYSYTYQLFSRIGLVTITPQKPGLMSFSPSSRIVDANQGLSGA